MSPERPRGIPGQSKFFDHAEKLLTCACHALELCVPCDSLEWPRVTQSTLGPKVISLMLERNIDHQAWHLFKGQEDMK